MTYRELDLLSNRVANTLIERGIAPGDRAAVYLPNGIELVVALCGALKAGAIVVPVSTRLAAAEVEIMMEDSTPAAVIFHAGARAAVKGFAAKLSESAADLRRWRGCRRARSQDRHDDGIAGAGRACVVRASTMR